MYENPNSSYFATGDGRLFLNLGSVIFIDAEEDEDDELEVTIVFEGGLSRNVLMDPDEYQRLLNELQIYHSKR